MTTPNEDLILKLRGQAYTTCRPDQLCDQAADLLQSQAERIKELEEQHHSAMQAAEKEIEYYLLKSAAQPLPFNAELSTPQGVEACMVNLPEPVAWLANYGGNVYTEAQLEQAVRDALDAQGVEDAATDPVAWINLAASSKMFRFLAPTEEDGTVVKDWQPLFTHPMPAQDVKDAERYRWLREQHWSTDTIAVVLNPKQAVKLGYVCPSDSLLDETIDAAITKGAK